MGGAAAAVAGVSAGDTAERPEGAKDEVKEASLTELDLKGDFFLGHPVGDQSF